MKGAAVVAVAILLSLSVGGCSQLFHRDDVAEQPLRERIGDLASVVEVASSVDRTFGATIWVSVRALVESDLQAIVAEADELLTGRDVTIKIAFDDHNLLTLVYPHGFSPEQLASEVHYWLAVSDANGAPLGMLLQQGRNGPYRNIWDPEKGDALDWEALRAVPDSSTAELSWYLDDMVAKSTMPTAEVIALRDRLAAVPLADDESVLLDYFAPGYVTVRYVSPEAGQADPTAVQSWPRVREIVSQVAAAGLPQANVVFNTDGFANGANLHLGDCVELYDEDPQWASNELVSALIDSGVVFPVGVGSGFCNDPYDY